MDLSLFTAGVMLTAISVSLALRAFGSSEVATVITGLAVRFRSETRPMNTEAINLAHGGVFEYNHTTVERAYSPLAACRRMIRRADTLPWHNKSTTGYIAFPPNRR